MTKEQIVELLSGIREHLESLSREASLIGKVIGVAKDELAKIDPTQDAESPHESK
jgi:hypothetical protein